MNRYDPGDDQSFRQSVLDGAALVLAGVQDDKVGLAHLLTGADSDDLEMLLAAVLSVAGQLALLTGEPVAAIELARDRALDQ
jgi:hypothetical protein